MPNKLTYKELVKKLNDFDLSPIISESEYLKCNTKKIKCLCLRCGDQANTAYRRVSALRRGCSHCSGKKISETKRANLKGRVFGKLKIVDYVSSGLYGPLWKCRCGCGNVKNILASNLLAGHCKSCGCALRNRGNRHHNFKGVGEIPREHIQRIIIGAGRRNITYKIKDKYLWDLFLKQDRKCSLSGVELKFGNIGEQTASLDRIDSSKGYIKGNVQWVHKKINVMKKAMSDEEFIDWCEKIICNTKGAIKCQ